MNRDCSGCDLRARGVHFAIPEAKIVPGILHTVRVALTLPKGRSSKALTSIESIIKDAKRTGAIQKAFEQAGLKNGIRVAPE
jgi:hypothetical protein